MKNDDLCCHLSCNPSFYCVRLIVVFVSKQAEPVLLFSLTHISINMNNACTIIDNALASMKHSPQLYWCYS